MVSMVSLCFYRCFTLPYIKFKMKNAIALQILYKHYSNLETMETTPIINAILLWLWRFAGNLMTSFQLPNCSIFVPRRRETLSRRQWTVVQCRRRRWPQALSTRNLGDRLKGVGFYMLTFMHVLRIYFISPHILCSATYFREQPHNGGQRRLFCLYQSNRLSLSRNNAHCHADETNHFLYSKFRELKSHWRVRRSRIASHAPLRGFNGPPASDPL